jgi:hypothetical protein
VLVCDWVVVDCADDVSVAEEVEEAAVAAVVAVVAVVVVPLDVVLVLAATACVVVALCPSRHASAPPIESMVATLNAVAALRAPAARGRRRRVTDAVGSSMTVNLRMVGE